MNLNLYDEAGKRIAIIENNFVSLLWNEGYNTVESFVLEVQKTDEFKEKIKVNRFVGRTDRKSLMIIKTVEITADTIRASGKQASRIFDDVAFIGTVYADANIALAIADGYEWSNKYPNAIIDPSGLYEMASFQMGNASILEFCKQYGQDADFGFRTVRKGTAYQLEFYKPNAEKTPVFSEKYGNLTVSGIDMSEEAYKNCAIVLGEGSGEDRARVIVDNSNGGQRYELVIDARDIQQEEGETYTEYLERLRERGREKLQECNKTWNCTFEPFEGEFGTKFDLGDMVTVLLPEYGLKIVARITKVSQKAQNNQIKTTLTVGELTIKR